MTRDVLVCVSGVQSATGEMEEHDEPIEVLSTGTYYFKNGKHYVFYEETQEGTEEITKSQIRWDKCGVLEVLKKGQANTHMIFEKGHKHLCKYQTPFGEMPLEIVTHDIVIQNLLDKITIQAEYCLEMDGEALTECKIHIYIQPRIHKMQ